MRRLVLVLIALVAVAGTGMLAWWRSHNVGPAQRGARLAAERGCLSCHGPGGRLADPDGTRGIGSAPSFEHDDVAEYARTEAELREEPDAGPAPLLQMPAWRGRLAPAEVDHLVAYVKAVSDFDPLPEAAAAGRDVAARLGCFSCHGPQGRFDTPNPGSLKGYVPAWSGADFEELARDDAEIREWIKDGGPKRLRDNPVAAFFLRRQAIRMPAYADRASEDEVRQVTAYIRWLRGASPSPPR